MNTAQKQQNSEAFYLRCIDKDGRYFTDNQVNLRSLSNRYNSFQTKRTEKLNGNVPTALDIETIHSEFITYLSSSDKYKELVVSEVFLSGLKLFVVDKVLMNAVNFPGKALIASDYVAKRLAEIKKYRDEKPAKFKKLNSTIKAIKQALLKNGIDFNQIPEHQVKALQNLLANIIAQAKPIEPVVEENTNIFDRQRILEEMPDEDFTDVFGISFPELRTEFPKFKRDIEGYIQSLDGDKLDRLNRYLDQRMTWHNDPNRKFPFIFGG